MKGLATLDEAVFMRDMGNDRTARLDQIGSLTGNRRLIEQLSFVLEVEKLKTVLRKTQLLDRSRVENDAEHTWELALMAAVLVEHADEPVDLLPVLKMLLIHDIVEIDAGDTFAFDAAGAIGKTERETAAAERIFNLLPDDQASAFRALWDEFEAGITPEARFANAMDRLQPLLHNFLTDGGTWRTPGVTIVDVRRRGAPIAESSKALAALAKAVFESGLSQQFIAPAALNDTV